MKKAAVYLLAAISMAALVGCAGGKPDYTGDESTSQSQTAIGEMVQIPSPWQSVSDMQEAEKLAGFTLEAPEAVKGAEQDLIQVMQSNEQPIVEVRYGEITIRKAPGEGDISGVYGDYEKTSLLVGTTEVSADKSGDACVLANWSKDGYTYSVYVPEGMSETEMAALAAEIQ